VIKWLTEKKKKIKSELWQIDMKLGEIFRNYPSQIFSITDKELISSLEKRKVDILRLDGETWRLRSRPFGSKVGIRTLSIFTNLLNIEGSLILFGN
jgi:hypothetical protein